MGCFPGKLGTAERHRTGKASTGRCCPNGSSERYSSLHCYLPLTTNVQPRATFLRVHLRVGKPVSERNRISWLIRFEPLIIAVSSGALVRSLEKPGNAHPKSYCFADLRLFWRSFPSVKCKKGEEEIKEISQTQRLSQRLRLPFYSTLPLLHSPFFHGPTGRDYAGSVHEKYFLDPPSFHRPPVSAVKTSQLAHNPASLCNTLLRSFVSLARVTRHLPTKACSGPRVFSLISIARCAKGSALAISFVE